MNRNRCAASSSSVICICCVSAACCQVDLTTDSLSVGAALPLYFKDEGKIMRRNESTAAEMTDCYIAGNCRSVRAEEQSSGDVSKQVVESVVGSPEQNWSDGE